jgi:hypothetical protein
LSLQFTKGQGMALQSSKVRRRMIALSACTASLIVAHPIIGPAQFAPAQNVPPIETPGELLDAVTKKKAAARLLAAMGSNTPVDTKVARLLDRLVVRDREEVQTAVTALVMLGSSAVPAIIRRIDDRREMPVRNIGFENRSPNSFEAVRWPGFVKVIDCLDCVLNDITGESFGSIDIVFVGDPDRPEFDVQRSAMVDGWRGYLARKQATPRAPGKSLPVTEPTQARYGKERNG